jgi:hypothetical protein
VVGAGLAEEAGMISALIHKLVIITYVTGVFVLMINVADAV